MKPITFEALPQSLAGPLVEEATFASGYAPTRPWWRLHQVLQAEGLRILRRVPDGLKCTIMVSRETMAGPMDIPTAVLREEVAKLLGELDLETPAPAPEPKLGQRWYAETPVDPANPVLGNVGILLMITRIVAMPDGRALVWTSADPVQPLPVWPPPVAQCLDPWWSFTESHIIRPRLVIPR